MRMAAAPRAASEAAQVPRAMAPSFSLGVGGGLVQKGSHPIGFLEGPAGTWGVSGMTTGRLASAYTSLTKIVVGLSEEGVASGVPYAVQQLSRNHLDHPTTLYATPSSSKSPWRSSFGALVSQFRLKDTTTLGQLTMANAPKSLYVAQFLLESAATSYQFFSGSSLMLQSVSLSPSKLSLSNSLYRSVSSKT